MGYPRRHKIGQTVTARRRHNYFKIFKPWEQCTWSITVLPGTVIAFDFLRFDLEDKHGSRCSDYLEIYNGIGSHSNSDLIGSYCGGELPKPANSEHNTVEIIFHSDSRTEGSGFAMSWSSMEETCGGVLKSEGGHIKSPSERDENLFSKISSRCSVEASKTRKNATTDLHQSAPLLGRKFSSKLLVAAPVERENPIIFKLEYFLNDLTLFFAFYRQR